MKIAVFPGSFDPFTIAHQDLIKRALPLFDKIYIAIGVNSSKVGMMDVESRKSSISELYKDNEQVEVGFYNGLTVDYCESIGADFILRGLRNGTDRKSTRLNSSHVKISYAVFCSKKKIDEKAKRGY